MGLGECCLLVIMIFGLGGYTVSSVNNGQGKGIISLNCGGAAYIDDSTGKKYISDEKYVTRLTTGVNRTIKPEWQYKYPKHLWDLTSFPQGQRNCYHFHLTKGNKYLIRAEFLYGDYDGLNKSPVFDVYIGSLRQDTVSPPVTQLHTMEVIHELRSSHLQFCLVKTDSSVPFISTLELCPVNKAAYKSTSAGTLQLFRRYDFGAEASKSLRFEDAFDRFWEPENDEDSFERLNTSLPIPPINEFQVPQLLMMSAVAPRNINTPIQIPFSVPYQHSQIYVFFYFAELQQLKAGEIRQFDIFFNEIMWLRDFSPNYLKTRVIYSTSPSVSSTRKCHFVLRKTKISTYPPLLNGLEIYLFKTFTENETNEGDVSAIIKIKMIYSLNKTTWEGDPCIPSTYMWEGVTCDTNYNIPRITSLNLASSSLEGVIAPEIFGMSQLVDLDLSNNNLTGTVPDFLSRMKQLKYINLSGNKFNGTVPPLLLEKSEKGLLKLSVKQNPDLWGVGGPRNNTSKKETNLLIAIVATLASIIVIISATAALRVFLKRRKHDEDLSNTNPPCNSVAGLVAKREFSYSEIERSTNNFTRVLGKGGFGVVYHGVVESQQVAVKLIDKGSVHAYQQFTTEVGILLRVHHKNLVSLNGYCHQGDHIALVYEFMANGDLKDHLSGKSGHILSWETRLKIATQVAQGLEYLHHGCNPPVIHRDVKTRNILLDEHFEAKLGDFGLSKFFPTDGATHVSTVVAGTPGYLDPEYLRSSWLTEKTDVFSFGIVLLELITNQGVIDYTRDKPMIREWAKSNVIEGNARDIIDLQLGGQFDPNSLQKAIDIGLACVNETCSERPTMKTVTLELHDCLALEIARTQRDWSESSVIPR